MLGCAVLGLLASTAISSPASTWRNELGRLVGTSTDCDLEAAMVAKMAAAKVQDPEKVMVALRWLGILDESRQMSSGTVMDGLCQLLESRLAFGPHERDMVLMHHDISVCLEKGVIERHSSSLMVFGDDRDSAMAKTVGLTCAMATELVLEGGLAGRKECHGVITPLAEEIYRPMLDRLEDQGLAFQEVVQQTPMR